MDMSPPGEFCRVVDEIVQHLQQPPPVGMDRGAGFLMRTGHFDCRGVHFQACRLFQFVHQCVQVMVGEIELQRSGLDLRQVEYVADKL